MKNLIETKEFHGLSVNTSTGDVYVYLNGEDKRRELSKVNGKYCVISSQKILTEATHISPIGKPTKYANFFNKLGQQEIENYMNR